MFLRKTIGSSIFSSLSVLFPNLRQCTRVLPRLSCRFSTFTNACCFSNTKVNSFVKVSKPCTSSYKIEQEPVMSEKMTNNSTFSQKYDYFLVLDFEATCDYYSPPTPQEIIEFPVLKVNGKTLLIESEFHWYVQPDEHKNLSSFCVELTGIIQDQVDGQPNLKEILKKFDVWMNNEGLLQPDIKITFVTCGDWDLRSMLPNQCEYLGLVIPHYMRSWINIKKSYCTTLKIWPKELTMMTQSLGLPHIGRLHSGIDDCKNIAAVLKCLAQKGHIFSENGRL